ncbi:hypothetical protein BGW38_003031 [Lunasporangiospora selenospora]|uniref:Protein kinase domain-containing protein n=1 Tax=Lunasporangiospora selenospora TaxID=979761 RepID=A0A9P6KD53_9FUNG|nr:hypothetical protein BGW38_003031 [Lunasporangiospora selenospora]
MSAAAVASTAQTSARTRPAPAPPAVVPCKYKTGRELGNGSYAVVKEAFHVGHATRLSSSFPLIQTGERFAVKIISKRLMAGKEHMIRNEIAVLQRISRGHAHILTMVDFFETHNNLYLVMELAEGGELYERLCEKGNYFEHDAANLVRTICSAVSYLHDMGIVHRDLKPENLLFKTKDDDSQLMIADFGLSKIVDQEAFHILTTTCGTPGYMAPEVFKKSGHGKPVDMWAIGVITYFLLCGYTPFDHENAIDELNAVLKAEYSFEPEDHWVGISDTAKSFIRALLTVDPNSRMTATEALQHPWLCPPRTWSSQPHQEFYPESEMAHAPMPESADVAGCPDGTEHTGLASSMVSTAEQHEQWQHQQQQQQVQQQQYGSYSQEMDTTGGKDLLPSVRARIKARNRFRNVVNAVRAANKIRELGAMVQAEEVSHVLHHEDVDME